MGLVSWTVGLPLLPVRGVLALGRIIEQQAEQERGSTASVRRRLEAVQAEHAGATDPRSARSEAEQVEQIVGEIVKPAPVVAPESDAAQSDPAPSSAAQSDPEQSDRAHRADAAARPSRADDGDDG